MSERKQMSDKQAEEFVKQHGPHVARNVAYVADHRHDVGTADALWEAAERADGGNTTSPN
ncbi:hypothetical protein E1161_08385 [Saccharopolyspora aridisoli]|uniref:Uncharacterized protein n=1 Tax=Saccharopolyspora aridisoli TaxID=2530385 RepID=A0A4R4UPT9_9PSEU|nr:hypothetical protein [Saccharopolyspora aridisoli]TDC94021.1 hypothetical protein E1161_08385 [Saccharopolyspora aridisoli]